MTRIQSSELYDDIGDFLEKTKLADNIDDINSVTVKALYEYLISNNFNKHSNEDDFDDNLTKYDEADIEAIIDTKNIDKLIKRFLNAHKKYVDLLSRYNKKSSKKAHKSRSHKKSVKKVVNKISPKKSSKKAYKSRSHKKSVKKSVKRVSPKKSSKKAHKSRSHKKIVKKSVKSSKSRSKKHINIHNNPLKNSLTTILEQLKNKLTEEVKDYASYYADNNDKKISSAEQERIVNSVLKNINLDELEETVKEQEEPEHWTGDMFREYLQEYSNLYEKYPIE